MHEYVTDVNRLVYLYSIKVYIYIKLDERQLNCNIVLDKNGESEIMQIFHITVSGKEVSFGI